MNITPIRTRLFKEKEDLASFVHAHIKKIPERSVIVVTSKIVALSEGRVVHEKSHEKKEILIQKESASAIKTKYAWLTVKDGMAMANAGIDESNAGGALILLPKDSYKTAALLRKKLKAIYKVKKLGVVISDSQINPLRAGVTAHALGYAGIQGVHDYRETKDLSGRTMKLSQTNVVDSLATAAALTMGEGAEQQPFALITNAPVSFIEKVNKKETFIKAKDDLYWPLVRTTRKKN